MSKFKVGTKVYCLDKLYEISQIKGITAYLIATEEGKIDVGWESLANLKTEEEYRQSRNLMNQFRMLIKFNDNDFYFTFIPVLTTLKEWLIISEDWKRYEDNPELLTEVINELSWSAYKFCQNRGRYEGTTKEYLQIKREQILINEEVDDYLSNNPLDRNGECYVLDMRTEDGIIYCW